MKKIHLPAYREYVKGVDEHPDQKMQKDRVNSFAHINKNMKLVRNKQHNCMSGLGYGSVIGKSMEVFLLQLDDKTAEIVGATKEELSTYYEWLSNYSHLRHAFIHKDVKRVMKDRVIPFDPNVDARLFMAAANASRQMWECWNPDHAPAERIRIWYDMVQMGTHPAIAFALCHSMIKKPAGYAIAAYLHGHEFLNADHLKHLNFIEKKLLLKGKTFKEEGHFDTIGGMYIANRPNGSSFHLSDFVIKRWGKVEKNENPFAPPNLGNAILTRDAFLGTLKEIVTDYTTKLKEMDVNVVQ